ncbi:cation/H+ exchanger 20 [Perilla frutescens var. frutescens]|nr:cation/H+ exchanger 20 [Perilla frutescens var. frutescens]
MASFNMSSMKTSSNEGLWEGQNPLHYAFPLLIVQTLLVILTSRLVAFFLSPLRQPLVVAEILGGILLGPSALGRDKHFMAWIFPPWSIPILESVASIGLLFFLFLVGLELDLNSIRRSWRPASGIAVAGISLPFVFGVGITFLTRKALKSPAQPEFAPNLMFIGVSLSITAFPVLARILAELKLLTTGVGETAMAAAAINDIVAWVLLALAVAVASGGKDASLIPIWILLSALGFVAFMLVVIRPAMTLLIRKCSLNSVGEGPHIIIILAGVMLAGFTTDMIGIHAILGAFVLGMTIPKSGELPAKLITRMEDFVSGLLLPLYFASTGLKTDISKIRGGEEWGMLAVVTAAACAGKILGTFAVAMMCTIPVRESLALGVLMNTKGLVELIVLNIGREKKVLDDKMFAILVLMALFNTFATTPIVMAIYRSDRNLSSHNLNKSSLEARRGDDEHRILACIRVAGELPSLITLVNSHIPTKVYIMRLVEMTGRSSSIVMVQRTRKNGIPCIARFSHNEFNQQVVAAFEAYNKREKVKFRPTTSVSTLPLMHKDICHIAEKKRAAMIILPFHRQWKREDGQEVEINLGQGWRGVNERVLANAPCSVALLFDCGFKLGLDTECGRDDRVRRVCIPFLGGPDSREALHLGSRMADHPRMRITVVKLYGTAQNRAQPSSSENITFSAFDTEQDEASLAEFKEKWDGTVSFIERETSNIMHELLALAQSAEFELIVVGKGRFPRAVAAAAAAAAADVDNQQVGYEELGQIGGMLASSPRRISTSLLVVQQHESAHNAHTLT